MADVLIRNLPDETLVRLDSAAAKAGMSRAAFLRDQLDKIANPLAQVTMDDLRRSAGLAKGVLDEEVMRGAWS